MTLLDLIGANSVEAIALLGENHPPQCYGGLFQQIETTVLSLNRLGLGRNHTIAAVLPNGPESAAAFAAIASGCTYAPLNPAYSVSEFRFYLTDLQAKALITQSAFCSAAVDAATTLGIQILTLSPQANGPAGAFELDQSGPAWDAVASNFAKPDDVALLLHSSGTTARPKLIPLTHRNLVASAASIAAGLKLKSSDRCLNVMPLFHVHGLIGAFLSSVAAGASVWCAPGFNAYRFPSWLKTSAATWYTAVPTMHQLLLSRVGDSRVESPQLRFVRSCSAALPARLAGELEAFFGCPVIQAYGMTEASHQIATNPLPPGLRVATTVGAPTGTEAMVMDEGGSALPDGVRGEIAIRGPGVTLGYSSPASANASAFSNGWLRTGDQGFVDENGYITLTGRLKEIINCGGEKVSPAEIDQVLGDHPAVANAVAFGVPCTLTGERVYAAVILRHAGGATERELKSFASDRLAKFKIPRRILIVDDLPKGATGKIQRIGMAQKLGVIVSE